MAADTTTATTRLVLPDHAEAVMRQVEDLQWTETFSDLAIHCQDGVVRSHRIMVCATSPMLKCILLGLEYDEDPCLVVPDVTVTQMATLLSLMYSGETNLYQSEIDTFVKLTNILKMVSIPARIVEQSWESRFPVSKRARPSKVTSSAKKRPGRPPKSATIAAPAPAPAPAPTQSLPPPTTVTRSGRRVVPRRFQDEIVGDDETADVVGSLDESTEIPIEAVAEEASTKEGPTCGEPKKVRLDDLFSVAEAIERSHQPDFCDVTDTAARVEGSATHREIIRDCLLCRKRLFGRHALARHMRNVHSRVFGPYSCPVDGCDKSVEDGVAFKNHLQNNHFGPRAMAAAKHEKFKCQKCDMSYTTQARLNLHLRSKHWMEVGVDERKFPCNLESGECEEKFRNMKELREHMKAAHDLKAFLCTEKDCGKRFAFKQQCDQHVQKHLGRKSYLCDICQMGFVTSRSLYLHRLLHLGRRFLCPHCGYRAKSNANLRSHFAQRHSGDERKVECHYCLKKFASNSNLKAHTMIHTGETPFECTLCAVKFRRQYHLNVHIESKSHQDAMQRAAESGQEIPAELDPARRKRAMSTLHEVSVAAVVEEDEDAKAQQFIVIAGDQEIHHVATDGEANETYIVP